MRYCSNTSIITHKRLLLGNKCKHRTHRKKKLCKIHEKKHTSNETMKRSSERERETQRVQRNREHVQENDIKY